MPTTTPEQEAYLALLRLPHTSVRHSAKIQGAMATLRDAIAEVDGEDAQVTQDRYEAFAAEAPAKLLSSAEVEQMREEIKRGRFSLSLVALHPTDGNLDYEVLRTDRQTLMEIFDLAAMAARIRER